MCSCHMRMFEHFGFVQCWTGELTGYCGYQLTQVKALNTKSKDELTLFTILNSVLLIGIFGNYLFLWYNSLFTFLFQVRSIKKF